MRANRLGLLCLLLALIGAVAAQGAETPDVLVKTTTEEVLSLIRQNKDRQKLLKLAEVKVSQHFDFSRMTRLAVGKGWQKASAQQQQRLQKEFKDLLLRTYANALSSAAHKDVSLTVKPLTLSAESKEATVRTVVAEPGHAPLPIDYQLEKSAQGWKVYDVIVEGISLVTNYRSSFDEEISMSGIDGLIKVLVDKNRQLAAGKAATSAPQENAGPHQVVLTLPRGAGWA